MDIEDDVAIVLGLSDARQGGMCGCGTIELEASKTALEIACVRKGQGFRDLDDQAAFHKFQALGMLFSVLELVMCTGDFP